MATFLFAWELGGGLGHVTVIRPLAAQLAARGHRVVVALRDLSSARAYFGDLGIAWLQAPIKIGASARPYEPVRTFAHVLFNTSFSDIDEAAGLARAWLNLFDLVKPDVVVGDHSPLALLAARGRGIARVAMGPGFYCPAVVERYPDWRPWLGEAGDALERDELRVLEHVNACAIGCGGRPFERLSQLYATDLTLLGTYRELDPFGERPRVRYRGPWGQGPGVAPWWPPGTGKRVFAYMKTFSGLRNVLGALRALQRPSIVFCAGKARELVREYASSSMVFAKRPVELAAAAMQCDVAITHGSHGTAAAMLAAGKPQLLFPLHLEQRLTAQAVVRCGAGLAAKPDETHIRERLERLLTQPQYACAARLIGRRYAALSPANEVAQACDELEALAAGAL